MEGQTITYDDLVIKTGTVLPVTVTGIEGAVGLVLGLITGTETHCDCDSDHEGGAEDGSEVARCVALADFDATEEDVEIPALFTGEVNEDALTFGGTDTLADHLTELHDAGIFPREILDA